MNRFKVIGLTCGLAALALVTNASASKIVINEFFRNGTFQGGTSTDEWVELVIIQDLTAAELESFFVGDSTSSPASKFSAYQFAAMSGISSTFKAGTIIVCGGAGVVTGEDVTYNGSSDKTLQLQFGGSHLVKQGANTGDLAATDVVWVDTSATGNTISTDGFAVGYGTGTGALKTAANVILSAAPSNGAPAILNASPVTGATTPANWSTPASGAGTRGTANGGANSSAITALPVTLSGFDVD